MGRLSPQLARLLLIRGVARALTPVAVLWGVCDWWLVRPLYAVIFAALTLNYVLVYILGWVAPAALNGPWRIRPWQTFVLLINAFVLPIVFKKTFGVLPWGFIIITVLFFIGLYAGTAILFYMQDRLPMGGIFHARRGGVPPGSRADPTSPAPAGSPPSATHAA